MSDISFNSIAYVKLILHAAKYPHCAVNGVLLADAATVNLGSKNQDLLIEDSVPLFHHSHYLSPMAEIALTQIETVAQADNKVIVGYYAACENIRDNTVEKCPGLKIAEKIVEHFPSAVFVVIDNQKISKNLESTAIKIHRLTEGKWKLKGTTWPHCDKAKSIASLSLEYHLEDELVDFDNYLDDISQDWTNKKIEKALFRIYKSLSESKE